MPFFGRKSHKYPLLTESFKFTEPPDPSWVDVIHAVASLSGNLTGAVKTVLQSKVDELPTLREFDFHVECLAFSLQVIDRIASEHGGADFRDALMDYLEPPAVVMMVDGFLIKREPESKEQAIEAVAAFHEIARTGIYKIYPHYARTVEIMLVEGYSQEGSLLGVLQDRMQDEFSITIGPMEYLGFISGFTDAFAESNCVELIGATVVVTA